MNRLAKLFFSGLLLSVSSVVLSQTPEIVHQNLLQSIGNKGKVAVEIDGLRSLLLSDKSAFVMALPLPTGEMVHFKLTPDRVMAEELALKYPSIRTFSGVALNQTNSTGRFDITPNGFHGMFYYNGQRVFLEPKSENIATENSHRLAQAGRAYITSTNEYNSYFSYDRPIKAGQKHHYHQPKTIVKQTPSLFASANKTASKSTESAMKTYRLAISATGEYTQFHGGTVDSTMAEIITLVNRLNGVYQRDLAIKLELVSNNDLLVYTDANTDPFNNDGDDGELNTGVINSVVGSTNYDIGHVVNTDGGGLAVLGAVCDPFSKGDGLTGSANPINDAFYIDYVAHEIGHQFNAEHTFNGTAQSCSGHRVNNAAYEVGSGSTIMAYAGICGDQNLQSHSDDFFHAISIDQIKAFTQTGTGSTCGTVTGVFNNLPTVDAGIDYTIPAHTPFVLSGSASDTDSESLSYSWQQFDLGTPSSSLVEQVDDGSRPLFRAFLPTSQTERYLPKLSDVLNNTISIGESLPTTDRELNFRLMVFDYDGGVNFDDVTLTVVDTGQAFAMSAPTLDDVWSTNSQSINWQVAATNTQPINCTSVDVLLSRDNGENFDITLAENVANNGSYTTSLSTFCASDINTSQARIKLACNNNIFFAINEGRFSIDKALSAEDLAITNQQALTVTQGESINLTSSQFNFACETPSTLTIESGDNYTFVDTSITPDSDFTGNLVVNLVASKAGISSAIYGVNITVEEKPEPEPVPGPTPEPTKPESSSSGSVFWLLFIGLILPWRVLQLTAATKHITPSLLLPRKDY